MEQAKGFTLLELLVVIAIVGIISAIAIPEYAEYRKRGYDMRARSDLYMVAIAEETYFIDNEKYLTCTDDACTALPGVIHLSNGVALAMKAGTAGFTGTSSHPSGSGKVYRWESEGGGMME